METVSNYHFIAIEEARQAMESLFEAVDTVTLVSELLFVVYLAGIAHAA